MPKPRPPDKVNILLRLLPEIVRDLQLAADRKGWTKSIYAAEALKEMLEKDGFNCEPMTEDPHARIHPIKRHRA